MLLHLGFFVLFVCLVVWWFIAVFGGLGCLVCWFGVYLFALAASLDLGLLVWAWLCCFVRCPFTCVARFCLDLSCCEHCATWCFCVIVCGYLIWVLAVELCTLVRGFGVVVCYCLWLFLLFVIWFMLWLWCCELTLIYCCLILNLDSVAFCLTVLGFVIAVFVVEFCFGRVVLNYVGLLVRWFN